MTLERLWLAAWIDGLERQVPEHCSLCNAYGWHVRGCPAAVRPVERPAPIPAPRVPRA